MSGNYQTIVAKLAEVDDYRAFMTAYRYAPCPLGSGCDHLSWTRLIR